MMTNFRVVSAITGMSGKFGFYRYSENMKMNVTCFPNFNISFLAQVCKIEWNIDNIVSNSLAELGFGRHQFYVYVDGKKQSLYSIQYIAPTQMAYECPAFLCQALDITPGGNLLYIFVFGLKSW